jgi:hypothetical protein
MNTSNTDSVSVDKVNTEQRSVFLVNTTEIISIRVVDKMGVESPINIIEPELNTTNNPMQNLTFINIFEEPIANSCNELISIVSFFKDSVKLENLLNKLSLHIEDKNIQCVLDMVDFLSTATETTKTTTETETATKATTATATATATTTTTTTTATATATATKHDGISPIRNIIDQIKNNLENSQLNLHDVPLVINIIANILNQFLPKTKIKVNAILIGAVIKLFVCVLIDLRILHTTENYFTNYNKLIDSCIVLLFTKIQVPNTKQKIFYCCGKN